MPGIIPRPITVPVNRGGAGRAVPPTPPDVNPATNPNAAGPVPVPVQHPFPQRPVAANQDPLGGDHPFANASQTKFVQSRLRAAGYNIGIDGVAGPQTVSAYKAYLAGVHPNAWAEAYTASHRAPAPPHDPAPTAHTTVIPTPPTHTTPVRTPAAATTAPPAAGGLIDPRAFARSSANEQYDPQIAALARQIAQARAQEGSAEGNIKDWYARLVGDSNSAANANNADASAILGGHDSAAAGLVAALGGSASAGAADVGANATIGRTALEGLGLSNSAFDRNIGRAYAGEGATAVGDQQRRYASDLKDAMAKQVDLQGAKGSAYTTALQNALVQRTNQAATQASTAKAQTDAQVEAKLAGVQVAQAHANLAGTQLANHINQWRYQQGIKDAAQGGGAGSVPEFTKQSPGQLSQLSNNLLNGLLGPKGNFNSDPSQAFDKIGGTLSTLSYGKWNPATNPAARNFVTGLVSSRLAAWNAQNPQKKYAVRNGQIVRI